MVRGTRRRRRRVARAARGSCFFFAPHNPAIACTGNPLRGTSIARCSVRANWRAWATGGV